MVFLRSPFAATLPPLPSVDSGDPRPTYHSVGYTSVRHAPRRPFALPMPTLDGRPVLEVKDVEYALFYPCEAPTTPAKDEGVPWVVGSLSSTVQGYSRFLGVSKHVLSAAFNLLVSYPQTLLPDVHRNAPLLLPSSERASWPLLVFSHGLGGGKHVYSQLCRWFAVRGFVVLVLQHKDGTGPATTVLDYTTGNTTELLYIRNEELTWDDKGEGSSPAGDDKIPLRRAQLQVRHVETYEAFASFSDMVKSGRSDRLLLEDGFAVEEWLGKVAVDSLHLGGHSFGGATTLHILSNPPPDGLPKLPVRSVLALDPWLDPLPPSDDPKLADKSLPPAFVINSEGFTLWTSHFNRLASIVRNWGGGKASAVLATLLRSEHQSFSDFPLILPTLPGLPFASAPKRTSTPESLLATIMRLSEAFLSDGSPAGAPDLKDWDHTPDDGQVEIEELPVSRGWLRKGDGKRTRRVIAGEDGEVRVHFAGP